ncbi:hypothetical protein TrRE_jg10799 [Triparma retinervis]|uniref:holocytochrome-c synthase n=1 Tax=Triparma retinervis TaxID=2557542 RepID=A0A9W7E7F9_9STRA|nr:hypothetical protein TrRE_jg10799 [Triparma retinervis]
MGQSASTASLPSTKQSQLPTPTPSNADDQSSKCPVKSQIYNVYSQPIDPKNNMPVHANNLPSSNQSSNLSTHRERSTIPKGGTDTGTWTYPSPQMFWNSINRKQKVDTTTESDIPAVVAIHNNMNETTWKKVVEWEQLQGHEGVKLEKFIGRPTDLSPKARLKSLLSHPLPFDRHDWTVLRPTGDRVRYIIDYYYDETLASTAPNSGMVDKNDHGKVECIMVDVRPAADSVEAVVARAIKMPIAVRGGETKFVPMKLLPSEELKKQRGESERTWETIITNEKAPVVVSEEEKARIKKSLAKISTDCSSLEKAVSNCGSDADCAKASLALTMCMARIGCPVQHMAFRKVLDDGEDEKVDKALEVVMECVGGLEGKSNFFSSSSNESKAMTMKLLDTTTSNDSLPSNTLLSPAEPTHTPAHTMSRNPSAPSLATLAAGDSTNGGKVLSTLLEGWSSKYGSHENAKHFVVPTQFPCATLQRALLNRSQESMNGILQNHCADDEKVSAVRQQYGLARWREYAVLRHGNSVKFQQTDHGRAMIQQEALRQNNDDVNVLQNKVASLDMDISDLQMKLEEEKLSKKETMMRVQQLEEEIQQYRDDPQINSKMLDFDERVLHQRQQSGVSMLSDLDDDEMNSKVEIKVSNAPPPKTINMADLRKRLSVSTAETEVTVQKSNQKRTNPSLQRTKSINESLVVDVETNTVRRGTSPKSTRRANLQNLMFGKQHAKLLKEERMRLAKEKKCMEEKKQREEEEERRKMEEEEEDEKRRIGEEEDGRAEKEEKLQILKLLKDQKAVLMKETKKLQEEIGALSSELAREELAGTNKMQQLRSELVRLKVEVEDGGQNSEDAEGRRRSTANF